MSDTFATPDDALDYLLDELGWPQEPYAEEAYDMLQRVLDEYYAYQRGPAK